jgi:hypothetical protein
LMPFLSKTCVPNVFFWGGSISLNGRAFTMPVLQQQFVKPWRPVAVGWIYLLEPTKVQSFSHPVRSNFNPWVNFDPTQVSKVSTSMQVQSWLSSSVLDIAAFVESGSHIAGRLCRLYQIQGHSNSPQTWTAKDKEHIWFAIETELRLTFSH